MPPSESKAMLKRIQKFLKDKEAVTDTANMILGLLMLTALVVFWKTGSDLSMYGIIFSGGAMTLSNSYRYLHQKGHKQMGYSMLLFGALILVFGVVLLVLSF